MERELALVPPHGPVTTAFWGGGTPGLLPADDLHRLGKAMVKAGGQPTEWSVELAPSSVRADKLKALRDVGVTRVSMGVQSFDEATLDALGRRHSTKQIRDAWELVQAAGFKSVNLDLIFAVPGQDEARWEADLQAAIALQPEHLSTYCLTFEEDTAMFVKLSKGKVKIDHELEARLYRRTWEILSDAGYEQYEISNFARPGYACQHNLDTWDMQEWIGYGPSASSQFAGRRQTNVHDLEQWLKGVESGKLATEQITELTPELLLCDALVFGLRTNLGVKPFALAQRFATSLPPKLTTFAKDLAEEGLATWDNTTLTLTNEGRLRADAVGVKILQLF